MKNIKLTIITIIFLISIGALIYINNSKQPDNDEQIMLEKTYNISKQYVLLRYKTDNVLINAKTYKDYDSWNKEMWTIISWWEQLEKDALSLETISTKVSEEKVSFDVISKTNAYNKQEISDVFDKAPAGKKIKTLAKFLWVDAKKAFKILQQDQAQVEADAWNEAWDTLQKLETSAVVIKDGCKVAWFVGWIIVTGWAAGFAGASTLSQAAVIVNWADMILEVTEDWANIALWNHNKISAIIWQWRKVTAPLASILSISDVPNNLKDWFWKFSSVMVALDQFNSAAQEWKIVGIQLPAYTKDTKKEQIKVSVIEKKELSEWFKDIWVSNTDTKKEEIEEILWKLDEEIKNETKDEVKTDEKEVDKSKETETSWDSEDIIWVREWIIKSTPSQNATEIETSLSLSINKDGTVVTTSEVDWFTHWIQEWNIVKFYAASWHEDWWYVFDLKGDTMTLLKVEWPDQGDKTKWVEVLAWSDFFWGKFYEITLKKQ